MKAYLKNYRQSPRKVRLVADMVRGENVMLAIKKLSFLPKRASLPVKKLIESAISNAENNFKVSKDELIVKEIAVDKGIVMKRYRPRSRGMANPVRKRTSNLKVVLAQKAK